MFPIGMCVTLMYDTVLWGYMAPGAEYMANFELCAARERVRWRERYTCWALNFH